MKFTPSYFPVLERARNKLGLTREDVAKVSRVEYSTIRDLEAGKRNSIGANDLESLCDTLGLEGGDVCYDYYMWPFDLKIKRVFVQVELLQEFMSRTGHNASSLATRAGVPPQVVYSLSSGKQRSCKAVSALKIARAASIAPEEFAPAFAMYSPQEMDAVEPD
jgi:transcriptional regulator with XRE-family HTH domain